MKKIETLVEDIDNYVGNNVLDYVNDNLEDFERELSETYRTRIQSKLNEPVVGSALRLSSVGTECVRKLWYRNNVPDKAGKLNSSVRLKFLFGDFLETLLLRLAEDSGHTVTGKQTELSLHGIKGHRDAVIDGVTTDCKSASSYSFRKFTEGLKAESDAFGYRWQLKSYVEAGVNDPLVTDKTRGAFFVIDKQFGHICLDIHDFSTEKFYETSEKRFSRLKTEVSQPYPPEREYYDVADGKSGNRKLDVACSYCEFKSLCWPELRTFIYSNGPRFLTEVKRVPDVKEV